MSVYYVSREESTPDEPRCGWYFATEEGECHGPYSERAMAEEAAQEWVPNVEEINA